MAWFFWRFQTVPRICLLNYYIPLTTNLADRCSLGGSILKPFFFLDIMLRLKCCWPKYLWLFRHVDNVELQGLPKMLSQIACIEVEEINVLTLESILLNSLNYVNLMIVILWFQPQDCSPSSNLGKWCSVYSIMHSGDH